MRRKSQTRATRGKLERALEQIESFLDSSNVDQVITGIEQSSLVKVRETIADIESRLWNEGDQR